VFLPLPWVTAFGLLMVASHNLFDHVKPESWGPIGWLWKILHSGGMIMPAEGYHFAAAYPLVPGIGVMAVGYGFGSLLVREPVERRKWLFGLGASLTALFVVLRALNVYGDPAPWSPQRNTLFALFSFLN